MKKVMDISVCKLDEKKYFLKSKTLNCDTAVES